MGNARTDYFPALRHRAIAPLFDLVVRATTRERSFKKHLLAQADLRPSVDVLDIGCGTGTLTFAAKEHQPEARVVGLDGDPTILEIASRKKHNSGHEVQFVDGLSDQLPFAGQAFDRVLCSLLLHHLEPDSKTATLAEIRRVLRPGGQLHIADWGAATGPLTRALFKPVQKLDGLANTIDHVEGRLPHYLADAGFERVRVRRNFLTMFGILSLFSCESGRRDLQRRMFTDGDHSTAAPIRSTGNGRPSAHTRAPSESYSHRASPAANGCHDGQRSYPLPKHPLEHRTPCHTPPAR